MAKPLPNMVKHKHPQMHKNPRNSMNHMPYKYKRNHTQAHLNQTDGKAKMKKKI